MIARNSGRLLATLVLLVATSAGASAQECAGGQRIVVGAAAGGSADAWIGLLAPAGTPLAIRQKINDDILAVMQEPELRTRFREAGFMAIGGSIAEFDAFLKEDERFSASLARELRLKVD